MDFFAAQIRAKRTTRALLVLYLLAVLSLIVLTNLAIFFSSQWVNQGPQLDFTAGFSPALILGVSLSVLAAIVLAIIYKWRQLQQGGRVIAESLGGQPVLPQTQSPNEKKLIHVVEEMALAAGLPVPPIYCIASSSINAFAAGFSPADAVIGVTRGAIDHLTRDELQAVVAHEFSHILNGDMRLNVQMLALLFGIECIAHAGRFLLRSQDHGGGYHRRGRDSGVVLGCLLLAVGYCGGLFASMIKAAINRQREYLADASAVQFTRYADGLANALIKVGEQGSVIVHQQADALGHFFFSEATASVWHRRLWATHPALELRIQKIKPRWTQGLAKFKTRARPSVEKTSQPISMLVDEQPATVLSEPLISDAWRQFVREPEQACLVVWALADQLSDQKRQFMFKQRSPALQKMRQALQALSRQQQLQLLTIAIVSLKNLSRAQYVDFKRTLRALIQADQQIDLFEWSLFELVTHSCDAQFTHRAVPQPQYQQIDAVLNEFVLVLTLLVQQVYPHVDQQRAAFEQAIKAIGLNNPPAWQTVTWDWLRFHAALKKLALAFPLLKSRMLKGWVQAQQSADISETADAQQLLNALAACLDVGFLLADLRIKTAV
jgi:Zn-dependent protease with chaperone function